MSDPQSRNEALIEAIINETTYTDPPQSRNEAILKSILDETEYTKAPQSRMEDLLIQLKEYIEEGGDGKIRLDDVDNADITLTGTTASITWKDPEDIIIQEVVLAEWAGTKVVRKAGSVPTSVDDGVLIVDSTIRDEYESAGFEDEGLEYDVTYYYRFFPYTTKGLVTNGTVKEVTAWATHIYGAEWDGTSTTAWTRTDESALFTDPVPAVNNGNGSSPFDNLMPWSGIRIVEDAETGTLVEIPKFWFKWTRTGSAMKLQIANREVEGFHVSPAHADRGDSKGERDYVYVGRYNIASDYKSKTDVLPGVSHTRAEFRASIHNLGSNVWQYDYAMFWTIRMLYLVEFADWDSQSKIGLGCSNGSSVEKTGSTDVMQYHTGTDAQSRDIHGHTQYRYIEDLWGNVYDLCDGARMSYNSTYNTWTLYINTIPSSYSDTSGGKSMCDITGGKNGFINQFSNINEVHKEHWALYPIGYSGSSNTYVCDRGTTQGTSAKVMRVGGSYDSGFSNGLFYIAADTSETTKASNLGARLQKLPERRLSA